MEDAEEVGESVTLGCTLEKFSEWKEILDMVDNLLTLENKSQVEKAYEKFRYILHQYNEQPHLLDSHLSLILDKIVDIVKCDSHPLEIRHHAFQYMHLITKVRGYKVVVQNLPHAAADLEPILALLESQDPTDTNTWETRYCLLLWLSIVVKIPFHMSRLDCSESGDSNYKPVMERILDMCKKYLLVGDSSREAAAFLTAHFLTRSDIKELYLTGFLEWACDIITQENKNWERYGPLSAVAAILKHGKREDLLPHATWLLQKMLLVNWRDQPYRLSRKYAIKIIQRIGLTFLKVRIISWRYKRGNRSLCVNLTNLSCGDNQWLRKPKEENEEEEEDQEVPPEIEEIIEELMQGLRDPDITIRWSAAKGIGRVMGRMNKILGDEVIGCIMDLLNPRESDSAWHGGCLALAELSKRGLLLPSRLPEVVSLVKKALVYDEPRGYISVGSHIRDAACYVVWSFARAYDSEIFKPFVNDIANALVVVACFDREINIRRAASAAFQEHIGRQGTFPHGIDIMTNADYFSVGVRSNAYLNISVYIAQYEEYTTSLIEHLVDRKVEHWDTAIRDLAGKALHNLTPLSPHYMVEIVLPTLLQKTSSIDVNVRHGAISAIGEVVHALSLIENVTLGDALLSAIRDLVKTVRDRLQFKGMSGELMKLACCHFIYKCSLAKLPFHNLEVIDDWQKLIDECLCHEVSLLRTKAAGALSALCSQFYQTNGFSDKEKCPKIVQIYTQKLQANDEIVRLGHALALGSLPSMMLLGSVDIVVNGLVNCATITLATEKWVDSRRNAIKALTSVCSTVGVTNPDPKMSCRAHIPVIMECFTEGLTDYTKDDRGDTGAWVRESSMTGLQVLLQLATVDAVEIITEDVVKRAMCGIVQQAVERIDRTRALAGTVFSSLLHNEPEIPFIPRREEILRIFPAEECKNGINWLSHDTFPKFTEMFALQEYSYHLMEGFIISVGGLTESLVKASSACLFSYLKSLPFEELARLCDIITTIYEKNLKVERIVLPVLSFLELLFSSGCVRPVLECPDSDFASKVFNLTKSLVGSTEKFKLLGSMDVYCQLIQVQGKVCRNALQRIMILLCHKFAWLRKATANKFYEALMIYNEDMGLSDEDLNTVLLILEETEWSSLTQEEVRPIRNKISAVFKLPVPVPTLAQKS